MSEKAFCGGYPSPCFLEVLIPEGDKAVCFHAVLGVLILKGVGAAP